MDVIVPPYFFDRQLGNPESGTKTVRQQVDTNGKGKIHCRSCFQPITDATQGINQNESHIHVCTNPHGHSFRFACFSEAPGCVEMGLASYQDSWFSAHSWQISICSACGEHLGWLFVGESRFYGLIINRLVDDNQASL